MDEDILLLRKLMLEGRCCSQVMTSMGLNLLGRDDPLLVEASGALCLGVRGGLTCGALSGAAMILSMYDPQLAASEMIPELTEWFSEMAEENWGGSNCRNILAGDPQNRALRCPKLMEEVWKKTREILEDEGFEVEIHQEILKED